MFRYLPVNTFLSSSGPLTKADHCDQECERHEDASSDTGILLPNNTRPNVEKVEKISGKNEKKRKKKSHINQVKPDSTGCTESSFQPGSDTINTDVT